ncbi:MAG: 23S rRNA (adenine(2030)-N(6))-methyltransferase RlmJ, partial [Gluconacetobacter diazotrophicus]|nr:23S rRNA (adenine(2030)-N(6))-methyltransferase RlmJ [Gluconacetobacter diazotrophicus]
MNYRHAFHAGNVADCVKHALLLVLLDALRRKPAPFAVLDTHAGIGAYDLSGSEATRTGEWRDGIGRLLDAPPDPVLVPFLDAVRAFGAPSRYPGSPSLIRAMLRPQDRLSCCELHPDDAATLRRTLRGDPRVSVHHRDGYEAVRALLPPADNIRRGLVLLDPPFERDDEWDRLRVAMLSARRRFNTAIVAAWYPIKSRAPSRAFLDALADAAPPDLVSAELLLRPPTDPARLNGAGLAVIAAPWGFAEEAAAILRALAERSAGASVCPSDIARAAAEDWRPLME